MSSPLQQPPEVWAEALRAVARPMAWIASRCEGERPDVSVPLLQPLADHLAQESPDYRDHEAVFLSTGEETGALFGVFIHRTARGQAQGGVRHWPYPTLASFLDDGLRLSLGMGRKCALAGLWWGGGKALIARQPGAQWRDPAYRCRVYADFGRFVTALRGCYVTAEDAGTTPVDMEEIYRHTRFVTCVPSELGGSGNPSGMTAMGVVCAMEAALDVLGLGDLEGKRVAMQGAGNVGSFMIERLLAKGVERIVATELSAERRAALLDHFSDPRLTVRQVDADDSAILAEPCDILAPNALGGVLGPKTIPSIQARIVCGAANNQLLDDEVDAVRLADRGVLYVPDYVANRMGIVACCNEHAGNLPEDPEVLRHLDRRAPDSVYQVTRGILEQARAAGTHPVAVANRIADERSQEPHPVWGHRARAIIRSLTERDAA